LGAASAATTAASPTTLPSPTAITPVRDAGAPNDFTVSWKRVTGVNHCNVSVFANGQDDVTVVPGAKTSLHVTGIDLATDMVPRTNATLESGKGYGVWFRSYLDTNGKIDGYTFQFDPGWANQFIIRSTHKLVVVAQGDTVWASVDGVEVFRVNSLQAAVASSACKYPLPHGTGIGFRTWYPSPATFEGTALS